MYWMDLSEGDLSFYRDVFGWAATEDAFTVDGQVVAGHGAPAIPGSGPRWSLHVQVDDVDRVCAGADVLVGPADSAMGRTAVIADPAGASFVVRAPGRQAEFLQKPMALTWAELCTKDLAAAKSFYSGLFGWAAVDITMVMPAGQVDYAVFMAGEAEVAGVLPAEGAFVPAEPPYWLPYLQVLDADAIVARTLDHGGAVPVAPFDIPRIGRVALLAGRSGETVAVMQMPS
jgi:predicted enzyme related to lactoylglutathione lyase